MTDVTSPSPAEPPPATTPQRRRRWWWLFAVAAVVAIAVPVLLVTAPTSSCGCAIPPSDDDAIETARDYVAGVASGSIDVADPDRAASLAALDDPATVWTSVHVRRPDGGYGDSPAVRIIVGLAPDGTWDAVSVRTETDYRHGTVGPDVRHLQESRPTVIRGGATPLFESVNGAGDHDDTVSAAALLAVGQETIRLPPLRGGSTLVYTGEGLAPGRYLVVEGGENTADDPPQPYVTGAWFEVTGSNR